MKQNGYASTRGKAYLPTNGIIYIMANRRVMSTDYAQLVHAPAIINLLYTALHSHERKIEKMKHP
jgi:hypothetical protein